MLRRIWNGPGVLVIAVVIVVALVIGGWMQYRSGQSSAREDCERIALRNNVSPSFCQ